MRLTLPVEAARFSLTQLEERMGFDNSVVGLIRELEVFTALLETQAQRSEGLENAAGAGPASSLAAVAPLAAGRADADYVRWGETYTLSLQLNATPLVIANIMQEADERASARLDLHLGDAGRAARFRPLLRRDGARSGPSRPSGTAPSIMRGRPCSTPRQNLPDPNDYAYIRGRRQDRFPGTASERWPGVLPVHLAAGDARVRMNC